MMFAKYQRLSTVALVVWQLAVIMTAVKWWQSSLWDFGFVPDVGDLQRLTFVAELLVKYEP